MNKPSDHLRSEAGRGTDVNICSLPNGMRLIHISSPTDVAYCGISIDAGTRDEELYEQGMAHFCEHLMFKGTTHRKAYHIINRMEAVGGDLNAYTNKEETVVYAAFMKEHLERAVDLIFDCVFNSTYPQAEMDKECEVVVEEIESYNDSPAELIFDLFENIIYKGRDLGHDILGRAEDIRRYTSEDAKRFTKRLYRPEKMIFFVMGNIPFEKVKRIVEKHTPYNNYTKADFPLLPLYDDVERTDGGDTEHTTLDKAPSGLPLNGMGGSYIEHRDTHQAHVMIGCAAYGSRNNKRIALYLINNILGGPGMNSRLNIALRERHGLVYTVESSLTNYTDTSTWAIYFGCDPDDVDKCCRLVRAELDKLMNNKLTQSQFNAVIRQIKGQIGVACDNFENYILDTAKSFLHYNRYEGVEDTFEHLDALTPELLQEVAREVFNKDNLTTLIIAP